MVLMAVMADILVVILDAVMVVLVADMADMAVVEAMVLVAMVAAMVETVAAMVETVAAIEVRPRTAAAQDLYRVSPEPRLAAGAAGRDVPADATGRAMARAAVRG